MGSGRTNGFRRGSNERGGRKQPSHFCHICASKSAYKKAELVHCANLATGKCTKSFCEECFDKHGWDWYVARPRPRGEAGGGPVQPHLGAVSARDDG